MPQPHILTVPHSFLLCISLCFIVMGIMIMTTTIPTESGCLPQGAPGGLIDTEDHDSLNELSYGAGILVLAIGVMLWIAGWLGFCGAIHNYHRWFATGGHWRRKCWLVSSAVLTFFALFVVLFAAAVIGWGFDIAQKVCDDSTCGITFGSGEVCRRACTSDVTGLSLIAMSEAKCQVVCKPDYDGFCDFKIKSLVGFGALVLCLFFSIIACACSCSAACCCKAKFEMADEVLGNQDPYSLEKGRA